MKKERNRNVVSNLEIAKRNRWRSVGAVLGVIIIMFILALFDNGWSIYRWIGTISIIVIFFAIFFIILEKIKLKEATRKLNIALVEWLLLEEVLTEVIPINHIEDKEGTEAKAKFYAIINKKEESLVTIYIKFPNQEKEFYEKVYKENFSKKYSIKHKKI